MWETVLAFEIWQQIIVGFVALFLLFQVYYYIRYRAAILFHRVDETPVEGNLPAISIVICAKNEARNLEKILPQILAQDYHEFEVVVVNDCSEDDSDDVLQLLCNEHKNLYVTTIHPDPIFKHGKKLAQTIGIKAAKHDYLLLTDADCIPNSNQWIKMMASHFAKGKDIVLGAYSIQKAKGLINRTQRYENLSSKIMYLGSALARKPFMGVGGNLAYKKELFFNSNGFSGHYHVPSGDDDLFINSVANKSNTAIEYRSDAQVVTKGKELWAQWFKQKRRHMGASTYYKSGDKSRLFFDTFSMGMFYVLATLSIVLNLIPLIIAGAIIFRLLLEFVVLNLAIRKLKHGKFVGSFLIYDLLLPAIYLILVLKNKLNPRGTRWK